MTPAEVGPLVLAGLVLAAFGAVLLYYCRAKAHLEVATYVRRGDAWRWRRVSLIGRKDVRICPDCHLPVPDYQSQEGHRAYHGELAGLIDALQEAVYGKGGRPVVHAEQVPWSAITEGNEED